METENKETNSEPTIIEVAKALNEKSEKINLPNDKKEFYLPKKIEKELFVQWLAQPEKARNPRTAKEFCKMFDVSEQTLSKWSHDTEVLSEVIARRKRDFIRRGSNVLEALYKKAIMGDPVAIKLYYQYTEDFETKSSQKHEIKAEGGLSELLKELGNNPEKLVK